MAETPRRLRGPYELRALLTSNVTSTLHRAGLARRSLGPDPEPPFVLRALHRGVVESEPALVERWVERARRRALVSHPHAVMLWEVEADDEGPYALMQYVPGASLIALLRAAARRGERLPAPVVARLLLDVLDGLEALHEARDVAGQPLGLCHGQIDPDRVLVGRDGRAQLSDACDVALEPMLRRLHSTPPPRELLRVRAPERLADGVVDVAGDVWGAGLLAWGLLAGRRFDPAAPGRGLARWSADGFDVPRVDAVRPEIPESVGDVLARALARRPHRRWRSAREMRQALALAWRDLGEVADHDTVGRLVLDRPAAHPPPPGEPEPDDLPPGGYRVNAAPGSPPPRVEPARPRASLARWAEVMLAWWNRQK